MRSVDISLDIPRAELISSNDRIHFRKKAQLTSALVERARYEVIENHIEWQLSRYTIHWQILSPTRRQFDADNFAPSTKALRDGLVRAGLLQDDTNECCIITSYSGCYDPSVPKAHYRLNAKISEVFISE